MKNFQKENQKSQEIIDLAKQFEVEELEERVEFGSWSANADGTYANCSGGDCSGSVKATATYTMKF